MKKYLPITSYFCVCCG